MAGFPKKWPDSGFAGAKIRHNPTSKRSAVWMLASSRLNADRNRVNTQFAVESLVAAGGCGVPPCSPRGWTVDWTAERVHAATRGGHDLASQVGGDRRRRNTLPESDFVVWTGALDSVDVYGTHRGPRGSVVVGIKQRRRCTSKTTNTRVLIERDLHTSSITRYRLHQTKLLVYP